jgi:hypothetical protein
MIWVPDPDPDFLPIPDPGSIVISSPKYKLNTGMKKIHKTCGIKKAKKLSHFIFIL